MTKLYLCIILALAIVYTEATHSTRPWYTHASTTPVSVTKGCGGSGACRPCPTGYSIYRKTDSYCNTRCLCEWTGMNQTTSGPIAVKIWIFLLIYLFSKVSKTYGSFSIESGPSVRPGETIVLECKKSDELHEAVYWKDGRVKLTTCLKDGDCYPKRSTIRTHITFATLPSLRAFYMIIHNATTSDFQTYICGDSHTEASCEIKLEEPKLSNPQQRMQNGNGTQNELSGTVNCTCKDELKGSAESECCNNGTRSSSDMPPSQKIERNDEERSQAVLLTFSLVFMSLSIFMNIVCIVFMVNRKRNEKRKHNDQ